MRRVFVAPVFLLLAISIAPSALMADAIASVTVQTDTTGQPGGSACKLTLSGARIECTSGTINVPFLMSAGGSASAELGSLSTFTGTNGPINYVASAYATASYDYQIIFPASYSGNITGEYILSVSAGTVNPGVGAGPYGDIALSQGSATASYPIENPQKVQNQIALTSTSVPGQPIEIKGNVSATALATYEVADASVQLVGFFDQAGNPIPFTVAPEPVEWPVLGLCLVLVWRGKRIRYES